MELSYLRVPTDLEDGEISSSGFSPKRSSRGFIRKIFRKLNLNRFGGVTERVLLVIIFSFSSHVSSTLYCPYLPAGTHVSRTSKALTG